LYGSSSQFLVPKNEVKFDNGDLHYNRRIDSGDRPVLSLGTKRIVIASNVI
jgi:hypothetical protein